MNYSLCYIYLRCLSVKGCSELLPISSFLHLWYVFHITLLKKTCVLENNTIYLYIGSKAEHYAKLKNHSVSINRLMLWFLRKYPIFQIQGDICGYVFGQTAIKCTSLFFALCLPCSWISWLVEAVAESYDRLCKYIILNNIEQTYNTLAISELAWLYLPKNKATHLETQNTGKNKFEIPFTTFSFKVTITQLHYI